MSKGMLTKDFFSSGGVEAEGSHEIAAALSEAAANVTEVAPQTSPPPNGMTP